MLVLGLVLPGDGEAWKMETVLEMNKLKQEIEEIEFAESLAKAYDKITAEFAASGTAAGGGSGVAAGAAAAKKNKICKTDQLAECFQQRLTQSEYSEIRSHGILTLKDLERAYGAFGSLYPNDAEVEIKDRQERLKVLKSRDEYLIGYVVSVFKSVDIRKAGKPTWVDIRTLPKSTFSERVAPWNPAAPGIQSKRPGGSGYNVYLSDELRTGPRGRARIEFEDRDPELNAGPSVVNVGSKALVKMERFEFQMRSKERLQRHGLMYLISGTIRAFTKNWGASSAFSVRTGTSLCGIRGTDIEISYDPDTDRVVYRLYEGVVTITTLYEEFNLNPMQTVTVTRGERGEIHKITGHKPKFDALLPTYVEPPPA